MIGLILIGSAVFAQPSETPWFINFNDGSRVVAYGDESDFDKTIFTVVEDTPWSEPGRTLPISKKDVKGHYRPTPVELESYYEAGWTAHDGIRIDTPHGAR